jgi:iron complex outermembrane receptor protein
VLSGTAAAIFAHTRYEDPLREAALGTTSLDFDATRVENSLALRLSLSDRFSVTPTVRGAVERTAIEVAATPGARARRDFARLAAQAEWSVTDDVVVRALASAECHHTSLTGQSPWSLPGDARGLADADAPCHPFEPSGRLGVQFGAAPLVVLANIGRYARVPTISELYGISVAVRGNAMLLPESGISGELGARVTAPRTSVLGGASLDAFAFVRAAGNFISYQRSSVGFVRPYNLGSARVAGLELLAAFRPLSLLLFEVSATAVDPRDTSETRPVNDVLPYQPRFKLASRVELSVPIANDICRWAKGSVSYFYESNRYADRGGLIVIPAQASLDVDGELGTLAGHLLLRARVANVLDQTRFDLVGFPLPGRAAYLSMEARW